MRWGRIAIISASTIAFAQPVMGERWGDGRYSNLKLYSATAIAEKCPRGVFEPKKYSPTQPIENGTCFGFIMGVLEMVRWFEAVKDDSSVLSQAGMDFVKRDYLHCIYDRVPSIQEYTMTFVAYVDRHDKRDMSQIPAMDVVMSAWQEAFPCK